MSTTLTGRVWQGQLFEARVLVPPGLAWQPAEPVLNGPTIHSDQKRPRNGLVASSEVLTVAFAAPIDSGGTFSLTFRGSSKASTGGSESIGLFQVPDAAQSNTEVALISGENRRFELGEAAPRRFIRVDPTTPPVAWPWPPGVTPAQAATAKWLRAEGPETAVTTRVTTRPRVVRHRSNLTLAFDRSGADVVAELVGDVVNGSTSGVEIALPPRWPIDGWPSQAKGWNAKRSILTQARAGGATDSSFPLPQTPSRSGSATASITTSARRVAP